MRGVCVGGVLAAVSCAAVLVVSGVAVAQTPAGPAASTDGWVSLFDGTSLTGWSSVGARGGLAVADGALAVKAGTTASYTGPAGRTTAGTFELALEAYTEAGASAAVRIQPPGGPGRRPLEILLKNTHEGGDLLTGSLDGVRGVYKAFAADGQWVPVVITVQAPRLQVRVAGALVVDYRQPAAYPADVAAPPPVVGGTVGVRGRAGTVRVRGLRVRALPALAGADAAPAPPPDGAALQILRLTQQGFPIIDLHAHLKGGLTMDQVLDLSRRTGMALGVAVNCGKGFPIEDDATALAAVESLRGQPVFAAMQAEGREWVTTFAKETRAAFDYVFTDGMTWTNPAGRRMRLWMPDEVEIGPDEQAFMDLLVSKIVGILEQEPIDIYVNPTFIPAVLQPRYDALWTEARMQKVIDAAVSHGVAIEINARYKIPSERFLRQAKASGATFSFGTNNAGATDLGDWSYPLLMQQRLGLTAADMFVPGRKPNRAQREGRQASR